MGSRRDERARANDRSARHQNVEILLIVVWIDLKPLVGRVRNAVLAPCCQQTIAFVWG